MSDWREGSRATSWFLACALTVAVQASARADETRLNEIERLERQVEDLRRQIEQLKKSEERPPAAIVEPVAKERAGYAEILERVAMGGYGSVRFEENSADDTHSTFTFRRFVLTADAAVAPRMRFNLELELERFRKLELERGVEVEEGGIKVEQAIEGTDESELSLEQAWLQYDFAEPFRMRLGGILVPLGRFNLHHDDNRWDLPRRPLIDRGTPVLPVKAAWDELGAGLNGNLAIGETGALDYHLYVVNGAVLAPEVESIVQTREDDRDKLELEAEFEPQTGTFGNDVKDEKAVTGRLAFSPALGHEIAGSFYRGRYTPDFLPSESLTSFGIDGLSTWGPFELEAEYLHSDFGDVTGLARAFAERAGEKSANNPESTSPDFETEIEFELASLAETRQGYWIEPRWRFRPAWLKSSIFGRPFEDPVLTAVVRWEQVWIDGQLQEVDFSGGQVTALEQADRRVDRFTVGGSYRPVPLVVFQLAYEFTRVDGGGLGAVTNFLASEDDEAHAVLVGAAFGF
jgi:hypothetical protein